MEHREHYQNAYVPEQVTASSVKDLAMETPVYIPSQIEMDDFAIRPTAFVTPERRLRLRLSMEITNEERQPDSLLGRIGIMRVLLIGGVNKLREALVADLRYLDDPLDVIEDEVPDDQEEMNDYFATQKDSAPVEAFITRENNEQTTAYYGPESLYSSLHRLEVHGNKLEAAIEQQRLMKQQKQAKKSSLIEKIKQLGNR